MAIAHFQTATVAKVEFESNQCEVLQVGSHRGDDACEVFEGGLQATVFATGREGQRFRQAVRKAQRTAQQIECCAYAWLMSQRAMMTTWPKQPTVLAILCRLWS